MPGEGRASTTFRATIVLRDGPANVAHHVSMHRGGFVYMMSNRPDGTLYVGVTADLARRAWEHRTGAVEGFTKRYGLKRLVWYEAHDDIRAAIARETSLKHWPRAWKVRLIHVANRAWRDLYDDIV
jgi:putative endonuclease